MSLERPRVIAGPLFYVILTGRGNSAILSLFSMRKTVRLFEKGGESNDAFVRFVIEYSADGGIRRLQ
jgi:hypothetical protein